MLEIISTNDSERWDNIVKSFKDHDVYYLSGYVKAFELHGDGKPLLFYFENGSTRAINVVMKRDISDDKHFVGKIEKGQYYDISTPYGYGGWIIEGENTDKLDKEYSEYCFDNNIVSEFVRFNPYLEDMSWLENIYNIRKIGKVVSIDTSNKDLIWSNISPRSRTKINKTRRLGAEVEISKNTEDIDVFLPLYKKTMDRNEADRYYYFKKSYFKELMQALRDNFLIIKVKYNNNLVASSIILFVNGKATYHLGGSVVEDKDINPVCLSFCEVSNWCSDNNVACFLLGGGVGGKEDNLYRFKKAFNKNGDKDFYIGGKIFNQQKYDELLDIRKQYDDSFDSFSQYIPLYRA